MLHGRDAELAVIGEALAGARGRGDSAALVVRGDPGIGKTALLAAAVDGAEGFRTIQAAGVEAEAELPYAGLHLLLGRGLDRLDVLPAVQAEALRGALGLASAGPPDRFLVGLSVLSLLSELAADRPLLCVVDDAQWLDRASADALVFAARRLGSEGVVMLFGSRPGDGVFPAAGLSELRLHGLSADAATVLLAAQGEFPAGLRYRILAESAGNPLALIELPRAVGHERPGDGPLPLTERLRDNFEGQMRGLSEQARALLLVAAAEGRGDLSVILRAAARLGACADDLEAARQAGLVRVSERELAFRHPLIRAAAQHAAPLGLRREAHRALAAVLDGPQDADQRAWHLAAAAEGPDEQVAAELERSAVRVGERARGAGVWYERAAELSTDPAATARRLTLASEALAETGDLDRAAALARRGASLTSDPLLAARLSRVLAAADFLRGDTAGGHRRLLEAAGKVATADPALSGAIVIEALHAAWYTGERELADSVARLEALPLPPGQRPAPLAGLLLHAVSPVLGRPTRDRSGSAADAAFEQARRVAHGNTQDLMLISGAALILGRDRLAQEIATDLAGQLRRQGLIGPLPGTLFYAASAQAYGGRPDEARQTIVEALQLAGDTAQQRWIDQLAETRAHLAAIEGDEEQLRRLVDAAHVAGVGEPAWSAPWTVWAHGLLDLGLGRADAALARLSELAPGRRFFHILATRSTPDLVEAAVRVGKPEAAVEPLELYKRWAGHIDQPWAAAVLQRCRALLADAADAEEHFRAALGPYAAEFRPFEKARTQLLYGEWLRRAKRKVEARTQLSAALETFERAGARPWAQRARSELTATGTPEPGGGAVSATAAALTPQELQIVRLAAQGLSNKEIAAQLFLSSRTVGSHLYRAYPKLGVLSRGALATLDLG